MDQNAFFFLGSCSSSSKCPRHLSCSSFSFGAILILPLLWHLAERSHILSLHRQTCWTAGCPVYKLHSPTIHWCEAPVQESDLQCCPSVLSSSKETMDRLQYCPEHLLLLTSKPQKKKKKTIWRGHAPVDINNWKISWSYQVYFRETRAIQWCSTHCYSETPLPSALWLLIKALLKFYQVTSCVQFIFLHSCKMW